MNLKLVLMISTRPIMPGSTLHAEHTIVHHCCNCHYSTDTRNPEKPLICNSKVGQNQFGKKAGNDGCAQTCKAFLSLNHFNTKGLKAKKAKE